MLMYTGLTSPLRRALDLRLVLEADPELEKTDASPEAPGRAELAEALWPRVLEAVGKGALETPGEPTGTQKMFAIDHDRILIAEAIAKGVLQADEARIVYEWRCRVRGPVEMSATGKTIMSLLAVATGSSWFTHRK